MLYTGEFNDFGSILSKLKKMQPVDLVYLDNMNEACLSLKEIRALVYFILELSKLFINFI